MKNLILIVLLFVSFNVYSQSKTIKVIEVNILDRYYIYKAINLTKQSDTLLLLGCKSNNNDFSEIKLDMGNQYEVTTRLISRVKISDESYLFCNPGVTVVNKIQISKKGSLPIVILKSEPVKTKN